MKKFLIFIPVISFLVLLLANSCKHDPIAGSVAPDPIPIIDTTTNGTPCDPDTVYFQNTILPLLTSSCAKSGCHDAGTHAEDVYMNSYSNIMSTAGVVPFNAGNSKLYKVLTDNDPENLMPPPPNAPFIAEQIALVQKWIQQGAKNNVCTSNDCDSVNVTFSGKIMPIINLYCVGCHGTSSPGGGIPLVTYANISGNITKVWNTINWISGSSPMPKGGQKLSQCQIAQFHKWIQDGSPNN